MNAAELSRGRVIAEALDVAPIADEELAKRGDAHSFALLYQRHAQSLFGYLSSRVALREEAEDLTGDVFDRAWRRRRGYSGHGTVRAWLFAIARHLLADHYGRVGVALPLEGHTVRDLADPEGSPDETILQDELTKHVRQLLEQLTAEQQEILQLRFGAELTYAEIGIVIGKREDAVKKAAYRALNALRGSITDA